MNKNVEIAKAISLQVVIVVLYVPVVIGLVYNTLSWLFDKEVSSLGLSIVFILILLLFRSIIKKLGVKIKNLLKDENE